MKQWSEGQFHVKSMEINDSSKPQIWNTAANYMEGFAKTIAFQTISYAAPAKLTPEDHIPSLEFCINIQEALEDDEHESFCDFLLRRHINDLIYVPPHYQKYSKSSRN